MKRKKNSLQYPQAGDLVLFDNYLIANTADFLNGYQNSWGPLDNKNFIGYIVEPLDDIASEVFFFNDGSTQRVFNQNLVLLQRNPK